MLLLLFQAGCCNTVSCLLQQAHSPDSQPPSRKKKKKSSWQGEAYFGRFLLANRLSGSRPNLRNCHRRRLHVEVFGSGPSELRAQLAHGHALTCARARTPHCRLICTDAGHSRLGPGGASPRFSPAERSSTPAAAEAECAGTGAPSDRRTPAPPG